MALTIAVGASARAQQTPNAAPAPTRERVFIASAGGDFSPNVAGNNSAERDVAARAYDEFFAGMKSWGRYEVVTDPALADWLFDIRGTDDSTCSEVQGKRGIEWQVQDDFAIELTMLHAKDKLVRKQFSVPVKSPGMFESASKIFDQAIATLVDDVREEVGDHGAKTSVTSVTGSLAPVPSRISAAQKVFIHDVSSGHNSEDKYSGGAGQVTNLLSTDLKSWGRYEIVGSLNEADVVFEIGFSVKPSCAVGGDPQFQFAIVDPRSDTLLWGATTHVGSALLAKNARKNFVQGMAELVTTMRDFAERSPGSHYAIQTYGPLPMPVNINVPKNVVKAGSQVQVKVTLSNTSQSELEFRYATGDPITCAVLVRDAKGDPVPDTAAGLKMKDAHAAWHAQPATYTLDPGETQTRECAVSDLHDMTAPGKYSIEVQELDGRAVRSNAVTVTVVP